MVRRQHVVAGLTVIAITYVGFLIAYFLTPADIYLVSAPAGRVIDQQTKNPVAGVSVLAIWEMRGGVLMLTPRIYPLHVAQAETDQEGYFRFKVPPFILYRTSAWNATLSGPQPVVFFLKSGYVPEAVSNRGVPKFESLLGKDLISVPVALGDDGQGLIALQKSTTLNMRPDQYGEGLLHSLKSLLLPIVISCDASEIAEFYTTFVNMIKDTSANNGEPNMLVSGIKSCDDRNYEYF
jgi:hypothetical protein